MSQASTSPVVRCAECNASLGKIAQATLPGVSRPEYCPRCTMRRRIKLMLAACPEDGDPGWDSLNEFEQEFLPSVREQYERRGELSEKQYQVLERIYKKV